MSSRQRVSPIAKARASKTVTAQEASSSSDASSSKRVSPIARAREGAKKGERRASVEKGPASKVSPIARARASKSPQLIHKDLEVADDDDMEFPPLSVPFGLECYLTRDEIQSAKDYIMKNKDMKFQMYTVDYDEDSTDKKKEYESVLVFGWFRPAVGVDINDIWTTWKSKSKKWHELLWAAKLMPQGKISPEIEFPEMLDPVEEEDEEEPSE